MSSPSKVATTIVRLSMADLCKRSTLGLVGIGIVPALTLHVLSHNIPSLTGLKSSEHGISLYLGARLLRATVWAPAISLSTSLGLAELHVEAGRGWWRRGWLATPQVLIAMVVASLFRALPSSIVHSSCPAFVRAIASLSAGMGVAYLLIRTFVWIPVIVMQGKSAFVALRRSWSMLQRREGLVVLLITITGLPMIIFGVALQRYPVLLAGFSGTTFPIIILVCCRTYVMLDTRFTLQRGQDP